MKTLLTPSASRQSASVGAQLPRKTCDISSWYGLDCAALRLGTHINATLRIALIHTPLNRFSDTLGFVMQKSKLLHHRCQGGFSVNFRDTARKRCHPYPRPSRRGSLAPHGKSERCLLSGQNHTQPNNRQPGVRGHEPCQYLPRKNERRRRRVAPHPRLLQSTRHLQLLPVPLLPQGASIP